MRFMLAFLVLLVTLIFGYFCDPRLGAATYTNAMPVKRGVLQTDLNGARFALTNLSAVIADTVTTTNGVVFYQRETIDTNSIPSSSAGVTNFVGMNLTNTIGGGGWTLVATNYTAASSFVLDRNGVRSFYP